MATKQTETLRKLTKQVKYIVIELFISDIYIFNHTPSFYLFHDTQSYLGFQTIFVMDSQCTKSNNGIGQIPGFI